MSSNHKSATLRVKEAVSRDVGRGISRIDLDVMTELNIKPGDIIQILSERTTAVKAMPGYPEDRGKNIIRIDGTIRTNAKVGIDDRVSIRTIQCPEATKLTLTPTEPIEIAGGTEYLVRILESTPITIGDRVRINFFGTPLDFIVADFRPRGENAIVVSTTEIEVAEKAAVDARTVSKITYEDIGGIGDQIQRIREMIELPLRYPELFEKLGIEPPRGILLHGPPGTGKTLLAKAVAYETEAHFISLNGPEIMSKFYGESEARLREIFEEAKKNAPSIIFIDELDSIAPKREEVTGEVERRVVAQLLSLMDGLKSRGQIVIIGATNRPDAIDPALRRPGRFDREIEIGVPDRNGRLDILQIHTRGMPLSKDIDLNSLANVTHGFVGADLTALSKEAAMRALRKVMPEIDLKSQTIPHHILEKLEVSMKDFLDALKEVEPSAMREVMVETPNIHWTDIGDLEEAKQELIEIVEWPLKYPEIFSYAKTSPPKGILLYGTPGTGKTLLAKALATESEVNFISVKGPELLSKWVGESEKGIREIFRKARTTAPTIIFFDEIDSLAPRRGSSHTDSGVTERIISQLLTEMDGLEELRNVIIIAATNRPDIMDPALLRPGRFDRLIYTSFPDKVAREKILQVHLREKPLEKNVDVAAIASRTENYVGADLASVCQEASMIAIREYIKQTKKSKKSKELFKIEMKHFNAALDKVKPAGKERLTHYEAQMKSFKESSKYLL